MDERTKLGLGVLGAALVLGSLGDWLLRATPWGINVLLWVAVLAGVAVALSRCGRLEIAGGGRWLVPVAVFFAAAVAWRDSPVVASLNVLAALVALSLAVFRGRRGVIQLSGISEYVLGGIYTGILSSAGPLPVMIRDVRWREVARGRWRGPALGVTRGVFLAVPLLLVFGGLFAAADAVFETLIVELFGFDVVELFGPVFLTLFFAWIVAGLLWVALLASNPESLAFPRPTALSLGIVETSVVLGLLDALFLAFVAVQVCYLFGGAERVVETTGLTYAEYARRGFFDLVPWRRSSSRCCSSPTGSSRPRTAPTSVSFGRSPEQWWRCCSSSWPPPSRGCTSTRSSSASPSCACTRRSLCSGSR
jgi:hypothetical protein